MHACHVVHHQQCFLFGNHLAYEKLKTRHQKSNCICDFLHILSSKRLVFVRFISAKIVFFLPHFDLAKICFLSTIGFCKNLVFVSAVQGILRPAVLRIATQRQLSIAPRCKLPALFTDCIQPLCIMDN